MSLLFQILRLSEDPNMPIEFRIAKAATTNEPQKEFLSTVVTEWQASPQLKAMKKGQRYFANQPDIEDRKRYYIDRQGVPVETKLLANARLKHHFLGKLVNQKVNYLLSKDFTIRAEDNDFGTKLESYFDSRFRVNLHSIGEDSVVNGISWLQIYYDEKGNLSFKQIPSEEVIPFWADAGHTELDALIRLYEVEEYDTLGSKVTYEVIEYYTKEGVYTYKRIKTVGTFEPVGDTQPSGHFEANGEQAVWDRIPFVAFKYNKKEMPLIDMIKELIDDYDTTTSDNSNNLQDIPNAVKVVKGYEDGDKEEFSKNLSTFRTIFVGEGGDVQSLNTKLDVAASDLHAERLRKDIFEFGGGVDTANKELRDVSGVALRFQYADLDMDCSKMTTQYNYAIDQVIWFIKKDMVNKSVTIKNDKYKIIFNTDVILNETETITNILSSKGTVSDKTLLAQHPWVGNVEEEMKAVDEQVKKQVQDEVTKAEELAKITKKYATATSTNSSSSKTKK